MERRTAQADDTSPERLVFDPQAQEFASATVAELDAVLGANVAREEGMMITDPQIEKQLQAEVSARIGI
jgi:hypothetical protein